MKKFDCQELDKPGQTATVTTRSASLSKIPFSFAGSFCGGDGAAALGHHDGGAGPERARLCYVNQD